MDSTTVYKILRPLIDELRTLIGGVSSTEPFGIIFRPGGVTTGNVYSAWGTAMTPGTVMHAVAQAGGACVVYVDPSIEAAVIPPGVYDGLGAAVLSPFRWLLAKNSPPRTTLTLQDGAILANWNGVVGPLMVACTCVTQPAFVNSYNSASFDLLRLEFGAGIVMLAGAAVAAIQVPAGGIGAIISLLHGSIDASATPGVPVISLDHDAGFALIIYSNFAFGGDTVSGDATTAIAFEHDDTSGPFVSALFAGALAENKTSLLDRGSSTVSSTGLPATPGFVPVADGAGNVVWGPAGSSGGAQASIIFQPGGVAGGNIFTSDATVAAAITAANGAVTVFLDDSFAPCVLTTLWNFQGRGSICGGESGGALQVQTLTVNDGGQIQDVFDIIACRIICKSQTIGSFGFTGPNNGINFYDGAWVQLDASCTLAPFEVPAGPGLFVRFDNIWQWDNSAAPGVPFFVMPDGTNMNLQFFRAPIPGGMLLFFPANLFSGSAATAVTINADASGWPMQAWSAATVVSEFQVDDARGVRYVPTSIPNWSGTNPSSVADALDRIAAHVGPIP